MNIPSCARCGAAQAAATDVVCMQCHAATSPSLAGRNLAGLTLRCADLRNIDLSDADLSGADLSGADLRGANLHGANVKRANLHGAKIDEIYSQYFTGCRLKGYDGDPEWQTPERPSPEGKFEVNGQPVRCPICGSESFVAGTALLETRGLAFLDLGWLNRGASILTCRACSRIEWFGQSPQRR